MRQPRRFSVNVVSSGAVPITGATSTASSAALWRASNGKVTLEVVRRRGRTACWSDGPSLSQVRPNRWMVPPSERISPKEHPQEGGLAGAVRTGDAVDLALPDIDRDAVDGDEIAVALRDVDRFDGKDVAHGGRTVEADREAGVKRPTGTGWRQWQA